MDRPFTRELPVGLYVRQPLGPQTRIRRGLQLLERKSRAACGQCRQLALHCMVHLRSTGCHSHRGILSSICRSDEPSRCIRTSWDYHAGRIPRQLPWHSCEQRVQLAVIITIIGLLVTAIAASIPSISPANFTPFTPNGLLPIGVSAALIFWSYLGYENVSNVAEEFKNPEKDFHRSIIYSVAIIGLLYTSVATAAIGTQAYKAGGSIAPFAAMLSNALGTYGATGTAILAIVIIFGTVNVYTTGISRVIYATAKDGGFPRFLDKVHARTGVPYRTLILLLGLSWLTLILFYFFKVDLETELLIPSGAAILVYLVGSVSGIRLLKITGIRRTFPWISLLITVIMIPFVGLPILISLAFATIGYFYRREAKQEGP